MTFFKNNREYKHEKDYAASVDNSGIFVNRYQDALPATCIAKAVQAHMDAPSEKRKKVAIIGFDGARADCLVPLLKSDAETTENAEPFSLLDQYRAQNGLFLSFTGGVKGKLQDTSTPQGWATILTGTWADQHKVDWTGILKEQKTVLRAYAEKGHKAAFNAIWPPHFDTTYSEEIKTSAQLKLPITYTPCTDNDDLLLEQMIHSVTTDDCDLSFCIFEYPDHVGHESELGFWKQNPRYIHAISHCDKNAYQVVQAIESRPAYSEEDWLIVVTTDHGGHLRGHGSQVYTDRTTFIGTNKPELFR